MSDINGFLARTLAFVSHVRSFLYNPQTNINSERWDIVLLGAFAYKIRIITNARKGGLLGSVFSCVIPYQLDNVQLSHTHLELYNFSYLPR